MNAAIASSGGTPLYTAARNGHSQCVEVRFCDAVKSEESLRSSFYSISNSDVFNVANAFICASRAVLLVLQTLLANGANVDCTTTPDRATPLYVAAWNGHSHCVEVRFCNGVRYIVPLQADFCVLMYLIL